jgi:hypothetical protein
MTESITLSEAFLEDLKGVCPGGAPPRLSNCFVSDLRRVAAMTDLMPQRKLTAESLDLNSLGQSLDAWRLRTRIRLKPLLDDVLAEDPLKCPISLFGTMDEGCLERAHTKTLAWLLNPKQEHGFGAGLIDALLRSLGNYAGELSVVSVDSEYPVPGRHHTGTGRLDLLATGHSADGGKWVLVIEAKIGAGEGENQLSDYDEWIDAAFPDCNRLRVFLTPDGRRPETARGEWVALSFAILVGIFRTALPGLREAPGYHFLRYYLSGVLRDICRWELPVDESCRDPYRVLEYLMAHRAHNDEGH